MPIKQKVEVIIEELRIQIGLKDSRVSVPLRLPTRKTNASEKSTVKHRFFKCSLSNSMIKSLQK
jgi:hypothetical protein